jgi:hypothetical protein
MNVAGLTATEASKVSRQLLLGNTVLSEIRASRSLKVHSHTSINKTLSKNLLKKYRHIREFSQNTGVGRNRLTLASVAKLKRRREIGRNRESVTKFLKRDDKSRQNPGKKDKLKHNGESHQTRTFNDYLKKVC